MTFTEIEYFIDVADCMNFTKAAEKNFVAQQVISKQIKKLEDELGYQLFDRSKRQLSLSEGGKLLYSFWKEMLEKQINVLQEASNIMQDHKQVIHVGCISISPIYDMISESISETANLGWHRNFQVENDSYKSLLQKLVNGEFDCILSLSDENRNLPEGFVEEQLDYWRPALIMSKNHPLNKSDFNYEEIQNTTIYILSTKFAFNAEKNILKCCKYYGFIPKNIRYFDDVASLEMALYAGSGVTFIYPQFLRNPYGRLVQFPLDDKVADINHLTVAYNQNKYEELSVFIDVLKQHIHLGVVD